MKEITTLDLEGKQMTIDEVMAIIADIKRLPATDPRSHIHKVANVIIMI